MWQKKIIQLPDSRIAEGVVLVDPVTGNPQSGGNIAQAIPDVNTLADFQRLYSFTLSADDFVTKRATSNGQLITALVIDPLVEDHTSNITYNTPVTIPHRMDIEASVNQRVKNQFSAVELFNNNADTNYEPDPTPDDIAIASISQTTTTLTIVLATPFMGFLSDWFSVYGLTDNRLNYCNLAVATISLDRLTITATTADEATIPSLSAGPYTTGSIRHYNNLLGAHNGYGMRFTGVSATQAVYVSMFGGNDVMVSGTLVGSHLVTTGSTAPVWTSAATGQAELKATTKFRFECDPDGAVFYDKGIDAVATAYTPRLLRGGVKPEHMSTYTPRFRAKVPKSASRPVAKIVSIAKAGSTTWTVTHDGSYTFVTGQYVTIKGNRDFTNFAPITTPTTITVLNSTQFTLIGATGTATGYGGSVIMANGNVDQPGIIGQTIQSVARDSAGRVTLIGSAAWAGLNVFEYVQLHGVSDGSTGANLGFDGVYEVGTISTTTLILVPVVDLFGTTRTPTGAVVTTTNCSGTVILRTTLRAHDLVLGAYSQAQMTIDGQGTQRVDKALPTVVLNSVAANTTEIALLAPSASNVVSAATTNATSIKATAGTLYAVGISNVTAATIYVKFYNKASAPTVGTDVPVLTLPVTAGQNIVPEFGRLGLRFATGIAMAITAAAAATDTTVVTAGAQVFTSYV